MIRILKRLKDANAEDRIWDTQFGFRSNYGANDALHLIRQLMDNTLATKDDPLIIVALDWAKAFDKITHEALYLSLRRLGIPAKLINMIKALYKSPSFVVEVDGYTSNSFIQETGIRQGCPMSPYLFILLMHVLLHFQYIRTSSTREIVQ